MEKSAGLILVFFILLFGCTEQGPVVTAPTSAASTVTVTVTAAANATAAPTAAPSPTSAPAASQSPTPGPTLEPTPSATPIPSIQAAGNERLVVTQFDLSNIANADYGHNPFVFRDSTGLPYYPNLEEGTLYWNGVPFSIAGSYDSSGRWSVISTGSTEFVLTSLQAGNEYFDELYFALSGGMIEGSEVFPVAEIILHYGDGSSQKRVVNANVDVWDYSQGTAGIPESGLLFSSGGGQPITVLKVPVLEGRKQVNNVEIKRAKAGFAGITVFAVTGVKMYETGKIRESVAEFPNKQANFSLTSYSSEGITLSPRQRDDGSIYYASSGTYTSGVIDAGTELVEWLEVSFETEVPARTSVEVQMRTGPTDSTNDYWSPWRKIDSGYVPGSLGVQFLQYRFLLSTGDENVSPTVKHIEFEYEAP